ncbi:MAG: hypothetical protein KAU31_12245 [Spirochaetaceae bacterium]|nr:hypothetical protein [Spirochaetaceae bacterium]
MAAGNISKNARREGTQQLLSRWGGKIIMKSVFENGKMKHFAVCDKSGTTGRKPRDLM